MLKLSLGKLYKLSAVIFATALALSSSVSAYAQQGPNTNFNKLQKPAQVSTPSNSNYQASSCSSLCYGYNYVPLYRFWSNQYNGHFYTIDENEKNAVIANYSGVWNFEGVAYYVEKPTYINGVYGCYGDPVYRFWSDSLAAHFYTISEPEAQYVYENLPSWNYFEGVAFCAFTNPSDAYYMMGSSAKPVYRFWSNPFQNHFYTISEAEKNAVIANYPDVWSFEGVAYYAGEN